MMSMGYEMIRMMILIGSVQILHWMKQLGIRGFSWLPPRKFRKQYGKLTICKGILVGKQLGVPK